MDSHHLLSLRRHHPAGRLFTVQTAPFIIGFLHAAFIESNLRAVGEQDLRAKLDDYLVVLREQWGDDAFPKDAGAHHLNEWADDDHGWRRRDYPPGVDEPHFDLAPALEQARMARRFATSPG